MGPVDRKISSRRGRPHQPFFSENEAKWSFVWYKNMDRSFFSFVTIHVFHRQTDEHNFHRQAASAFHTAWQKMQAGHVAKKQKKTKKRNLRWDDILIQTTYVLPYQSCHIAWDPRCSHLCQVSTKVIMSFWLTGGRNQPGSAENAGVENAGVENVGVESRGRKCRSGKCRSRSHVWKMQEWKIQKR